MTAPKVYQAITKVAYELSVEGIAKAKENKAQGFKFRGIDDVLNALSPKLAEAHLVILPNVLERVVSQHQTAKGGTLFFVALKVRYDLISADDGSKAEVHAYGEAMDSGDKATGKAMSMAYKSAMIQAFCIPTEADDSDYTTHDVVGRQIDNTIPAATVAAAAAVLAQSQATQQQAHTGLTDGEMLDVETALSEASDYDALRKIYVGAYRKAEQGGNKGNLTKLQGWYEEGKQTLVRAGKPVPGVKAGEAKQ